MLIEEPGGGRPGNIAEFPKASSAFNEMFTAAELTLVKVQKVSEVIPAVHFGLRNVVSVTVRLNAYGAGLVLLIMIIAWLDAGGLNGAGGKIGPGQTNANLCRCCAGHVLRFTAGSIADVSLTGTKKFEQPGNTVICKVGCPVVGKVG